MTRPFQSSLRDERKVWGHTFRGLKPTATVASSLRDVGSPSLCSVGTAHHNLLWFGGQCPPYELRPGHKILNGYPVDSSPSRSEVMMVAVGFNPRIGSRDIASRRVAMVEKKPRAIGQPGHFNRRYATNGRCGATRSVG